MAVVHRVKAAGDLMQSDRFTPPGTLRKGCAPRYVSQTAAISLTLFACAIGLCAGCSWQPPVKTLRRATGLRVQIGARQAPAGTRLTYRRSDPTDESAEAMPEYIVAVDKHRHVEGDLTDINLAPIRSFLQQGDAPATQALNWPKTPRPAWAIYLTFDPPLDACPESLAGDEKVTCVSKFDVFNWKGKRLASGSASRTFRFRGYEDVTIGDNRYGDCVRIRVETRLTVPFACDVTTTDYVWLSPGIGPVRRVQTIRGSLLVRRLSSATQWDLVHIRPGESQSKGLPLFGPWRRVAAHMHPANSKTRLWGLAIESTDFPD